MAKFLSRALLGKMAIDQLRKFARSPQGQQMINKARTAAKDPAMRAKLQQSLGQVTGKVKRGGAAGAAGPAAASGSGVVIAGPGADNPYPPSAAPSAPLSSPAPGTIPPTA